MMGEKNWGEIGYGVQIGYMLCVGSTNSLKYIHIQTIILCLNFFRKYETLVSIFLVT